jgi:hypothetical protein
MDTRIPNVGKPIDRKTILALEIMSRSALDPLNDPTIQGSFATAASGQHARTATGAAELPFGAAVQLDMVLLLA